MKLAVGLFVGCALAGSGTAAEPLRVSAYATAGGIVRYLGPPEKRAAVTETLRRLGVNGIFLEGRRGDEYVPPKLLAELRDHFRAAGFRVAGGIATVPGKSFGVRQNEPLGWLNWQNEKTQREIAHFFRENAAVFDRLIVDDFYCTGDTSPESDRARRGRPWSEYRQDLLVGLLEPMMFAPARAVRPDIELIIKYPQWYDRFHVFGYAPDRMSQPFPRVWVGTEVRNPETQRMGFVQPTQGYMNFRWITSVAGGKVEGAWFDHIECTAQNFVDQAYMSILAGARELTLFHLGDLIEGHPGHRPYLAALPELAELAGQVRGQTREGWVFYKPVGSDAEENLFVADYLGMLGLPLEPRAQWPAETRAVVLAVQAAADPAVMERARKMVEAGGAVLFTPQALRKLGDEAQRWAGVTVGPSPRSGAAAAAGSKGRMTTLAVPLEVDAAVDAPPAATRLVAQVSGKNVPLLTVRRAGRGQVLVLNIRTFSEADYRATGEFLLPPKALGWPALPREVADPLRAALLQPAGLRFSAPARVALFRFARGAYAYNFLPEPAPVEWMGQRVTLPANRGQWLDSR